MPVNLIVKLHDRSRDLRERYSGGVDWAARLQPLLAPGRGVLAPGHDISPYLVAADLMITDHSSAGFEFLLRDRPLVRIHRPQLIELANIHPDYVALLASVSRLGRRPAGRRSPRSSGLSPIPTAQSAERRRVAADLFYRPGGATGAIGARSCTTLIELDARAASRPLAPGGRGAMASRQRSHAGVQRRALHRRGDRLRPGADRSPTGS